MTRTTLGRSGGSAGNADEDGRFLRIDAAVFESLSLRRRSDCEAESPLVLRWFETWAGARE